MPDGTASRLSFEKLSPRGIPWPTWCRSLLALIDRLAQAVDIDAVFRRAQLSAIPVPGTGKPQGTTAEFFAFWGAVEQMGVEADLGLRLGVETLTELSGRLDLGGTAFADARREGLGEARALQASLLSRTDLDWIVRMARLRLRFEWVLADEVPPPLVTDLSVRVHPRGRSAWDYEADKAEKRIELTRRRIHEAALRRHFRCEIKFDAPNDVLVFDDASLVHCRLVTIVTCSSSPVLLPGLELAVAQDQRGQTLVQGIVPTRALRVDVRRPSGDEQHREVRSE